MPIGLFALALAAFAVGTTEFVIIALIPEMARDLAVSVPTAGLLVSLYAVAITVGSPILTALMGTLQRRPLAIGLMVIFTLGNLLAGVAPNYGVLLAGRIITGAAHGVFFAIGATVATSLVDKARSGQAVSFMFAGLTVAMVVGVPLGSFVGQHLGWRAPFLAVVALGAISVVGLIAFLPKNIPLTRPPGMLSQFALLAKPQLLGMYMVTVFGYGGSFVVFTYLSPLMTQVTKVSENTVTLALMLFGAASFVGNLIGGRIADRIGPRRTLRFAIIGLCVVLPLLTVSARNPVTMFVGLFVWGVLLFCISPTVQSGVVAIAEEEAPDAVGTASGFNIAAFNLGVTIASFAGSLVMAGPGILATPWVALASTLLGLAIVQWWLKERRAAFA
ncbi:MAG: MFS transporter [Novosphingobium sp.]